MGYYNNVFDGCNDQTDIGAVMRNGREVILQAYNWESHKHNWYKNLDAKVPDISKSGFTSAWLPPPSQSLAPEGYLPQDLYSLNSAYGSEHLLKSLLGKMKQYKVRAMADIVINHRIGTTRGHGNRSTGDNASSGELPSFVWMASSLGGILGNLLGGIAIKTFSSQSTFLVFGLLALLQFLVTLNIREKSLNLPENHSPSGGGGGIKSHVSDLSRVLRKPEISYSIAWMALSTALEADRSHSGNYSCLRGVGPIVRERSVQRLGSGGLCLRALRFGDIGDFVLFQEPAVHGVDDEAVSRGCEGSLMAFVMSAIALAFIVSGYLGIVLASFVEVTVDDHSGFAGGLAVEAVCVVVPLVFTSWIYDEEEKSKKEE
ncbi:hypothetical protein Bca52824_094862 [Brassica carinata]|uniref:Glycosyl hydrolase family 13 catalytic domain-containing protein n=1 Tax=Brassica carinata TaxID=52824 RepID=A0A8X7P3K8_BRACI|nr:hypothetical protein Bca52824_094862 [Brassica carinata]